jgi:branched-chain amino acid transport system substrate-binding protein
VPVVNRNIAVTLLRALSHAHSMGPRGLKEALGRVKMVPAVSGAPGHAGILRQLDPAGWMGLGYLVARRLDADGVNSHFVDRLGAE